jgi:TRAP-type C4-dicarboxylate transport system permease small subunit
MEKAKGLLEKICGIMNKTLMFSALVFLGIMVIALFVQVFTRYIMNASLSGTEELARYCFVWCTMLGAGICVASDDHAAVTILNDSLKGKLKVLHLRLIDGIITICGFILLVQGQKMAQLTVRQVTPSLLLPMSVVYSALVVGSVAIIVNSVNNMFHRGDPIC